MKQKKTDPIAAVRTGHSQMNMPIDDAGLPEAAQEFLRIYCQTDEERTAFVATFRHCTALRERAERLRLADEIENMPCPTDEEHADLPHRGRTREGRRQLSRGGLRNISRKQVKSPGSSRFYAVA
jgi:hypothetical protein